MLMSDFAKIVRATDGKIVLFLKDQNDEGKPTLYTMTEQDGITVKMGFQFADDDVGYDARDEAYEACGLEGADNFRKRVIDLLEQ
jgi:hypothetical protein